MSYPHSRRQHRSSTRDPDASPQARQERARAHGSWGPTWRQLRDRPFVGVADAVSARCWCGRPLRDSTGRCREEHDPPT